MRRWLGSVSGGRNRGLFRYQPYDGRGFTPSMTSVGLLCQQYLGMRSDDPAMTEGAVFLMENLPGRQQLRDIYYWYYATMVMHNLQDVDMDRWNRWNRTTRRLLIETQNRSADQCANGSWAPDKPTADRWGDAAGRHMVTTLSVLTLEVYYRYLPLYKLDAEGDTKGPPPPVSPGDKPPAEKPAGGKPPAEKPPAEKVPAEKPAAKPAPAKDAPAKDAKK